VRRLSRYTCAGLALIVPLGLAVVEAGAQTPPQPQPPGSPQQHRFSGVGGTVSSASSGSFVVTDRKGNAVTVRVTPTTRLVTSQPATLADIHQGDAVRIVADRAQDGSLTARFVQDIAAVPPTGSQGRDGMRPAGSERVMVAGSVTRVPAAGTLVVTTANGQSASIVVPSTAPVSRLVPAPFTNPAVGARVMVQGTPNPDGSVTASLVFVGGGRGR